jgi:hypothetical protein
MDELDLPQQDTEVYVEAPSEVGPISDNVDEALRLDTQNAMNLADELAADIGDEN